jgi:two-component system NtrC family sensor kinase
LKEQILFIDSDPETRQLTKTVLSPNNWEYLKAFSGKEGLRLAEDCDPALIILDHRLPTCDGFSLLEELRSRCADVPVIVTSADGSTRTILRAFRLGASDFLVKPFDLEEMSAAVQRTLRPDHSSPKRRDLTRRLRRANQQLQAQFQELNTVYAIGRAVTSLLDLNQVLSRVVEAAVYTVGAEEGTLMLLDEKSNELYLRAAKDVSEKTARNLRLRVEDSAAGRALQNDRPVHLAGDSVKVATGYLVKSLLYVPLRVPERGAIGVLGVANRWASKTFSQRDISLMSALADYAAIAIENARLFKHAETQRVKLEAVLREAEEAIVVVDQDNRVLLCNAAACDIWHLSADGVSESQAPRPIEEVIRDATVRDLLVETDVEDQTTHRQVTLSNERTYNAHLTPVKGVGRVLMLQDITHLKELDRLKSEFVATVSHDLRTPLTSIQGYIELLPQVGPLNKRQERFVRRVEATLKSISALINDLLDIRRIEAELDLEMKLCDLGEIIQEVVARLEHHAEGKAQDLRCEIPESLPLVRGNPQRLAQVLDNLVNNAIKYTQVGGRITVTAIGDQGHVVVNVSDNGPGIPPEEQPRIFDKFYRVESEEVTGVAGTGLGLAIVKAIVEKHRGRVWVESQSGVGSTFSFVLPGVDAEG